MLYLKCARKTYTCLIPLTFILAHHQERPLKITSQNDTVASAVPQKINLVAVKLEVSELMIEVCKERTSNSKCSFNSIGIIQNVSELISHFPISKSQPQLAYLFSPSGLLYWSSQIPPTPPASNSVVQGIQNQLAASRTYEMLLSTSFKDPMCTSTTTRCWDMKQLLPKGVFEILVSQDNLNLL